MAVSVPIIRMIEPGYTDPFVQMVQAQIDAARAQIGDIYADAYRAAALQARVREQADDDEIVAVLMQDEADDVAMVRQFMAVANKLMGNHGRSGKHATRGTSPTDS